MVKRMEEYLRNAQAATKAAKASRTLVGDDHPMKAKLVQNVLDTEAMVNRQVASLSFWASLKTA